MLAIAKPKNGTSATVQALSFLTVRLAECLYLNL
jgi:hypothetical protein